MFAEFSEFLKKFNVIPAAIGFILALATLPVMEAVVNVIMSLIGKAGGLDVNFDDWEPGEIPLGVLITALITFILIAFSVFIIIKAITRVGGDTSAGPTADQALLTEIRDLLKSGR